MVIPREQIAGLVLAGGRATRMGGVDKGLQVFLDEPMVAHVMRRLQPQVGQLMINANRHHDEYAKLGVPVFPDDVEGYAGPLAGIHAGLARCPTEFLATSPCDAPLLPTDLVQRLALALEASGADAALAVSGDGAHRRRHPVFMLARAALANNLAGYIAAGSRKVDGWLGSIRSVEVWFEHEDSFTNVNTPDDLQALTRQARLTPPASPY